MRRLLTSVLSVVSLTCCFPGAPNVVCGPGTVLVGEVCFPTDAGTQAGGGAGGNGNTGGGTAVGGGNASGGGSGASGGGHATGGGKAGGAGGGKTGGSGGSGGGIAGGSGGSGGGTAGGSGGAGGGATGGVGGGTTGGGSGGSTGGGGGGVILPFDGGPNPTGDSCDSVMPLNFDGKGIAKVSEDTTGTKNDSKASCGGELANDQVYGFSIAAPQTFDAVVKVTNFNPAVYLRNSCADTSKGSELLCEGNFFPVNGTLTAHHVLPAGSYYLWIDGISVTGLGSSGPYELTVGLQDVLPGEACLMPEKLPFSNDADGGTVALSGSTASYAHDSTGSCGGAKADIAYTFTTQRPVDLKARLTSRTSGYNPALYLRDADCTTERVCSKGTDASPVDLSYSQLPAGTYFLFVDGDGVAGRFQLEASLN